MFYIFIGSSISRCDSESNSCKRKKQVIMRYWFEDLFV